MKKEMLVPGSTYHIYNHANGKENLFISNDNFNFFLKRYAHFIEPIANTIAYCLMPNHLHLLVKIKEVEELNINIDLQGFRNLEGLSLEELASKKCSQQFSNLFNSYTKAFNKQQSRMGGLFISNFKRKLIDNPKYFSNVFAYIHNNPIEHGFVKEIEDWEHSSYHAYLSFKNTKLKKDVAISHFESRENLLDFIKAYKTELNSYFTFS